MLAVMRALPGSIEATRGNSIDSPALMRTRLVSPCSGVIGLMANVASLSPEMARSEVRSNPFSRESLNKLVELEKRSGNADMVAYLEGRIATLGTGPQ